MSPSLFAVSLLCAAAVGAPPPPALPAHPAHLQRISPLDYYLDHPNGMNYYNRAQQQQGGASAARAGASGRLETLEPDSEVELVPGVQPPQQPPQQPPLVPGLLPGQRVFIVHMPVPGYSPGTIGGYQPVYVVAAAPPPGAPHALYPHDGVQGPVFLDPAAQAPAAQGPGLLVHTPFGVVYQEPLLAYRAPGVPGLTSQQSLSLPQGQAPATRAPEASTLEVKRPAGASESAETKENIEEPRRTSETSEARIMTNI